MKPCCLGILPSGATEKVEFSSLAGIQFADHDIGYHLKGKRTRHVEG